MRTISPKSLMYIGIKGTVVALDRRTGVEYWRTPLKGSDFVNVALDDESVFATARGEVFCLEPATGRVLWNNPLKGMGWGLITIAGAGIVPMATHRANQQASAGATAAATPG